MTLKRLLALAAVLLAACAWSPDSNWHLMDSGYSLEHTNAHEFAMEVHLNQLKQLGGDLHSAQFRLFVSERLKWHDMCPFGWEYLRCTEDGSCVQRTARSVTVSGRCAAP
jgi:hypothetical protein